MAKKDGEGPDAVRLPGDPITEPKELSLGITPPAAANSDPEPKPPAAPISAKPEAKADPKPAAPIEKKEPKPAAAAEPDGDGPHNNYGVATPSGSSPNEWIKYDEDVLKAKDAYDAAQAKTAKEKAAAAAGATDIAPRPAEPAAPVTAADPNEPQPPPKPGAGAALAADDKFDLEPGNTWTRSQIVNEIAGLRTMRDERDKALGLFGLASYEDLEKGWKPFLDNARANPGLVPFLDKAQGDFFLGEEDPGFIEFMDANRAKYLEWRKENPGAAPTRRPSAAGAPAEESALAQEVRALKEQIAAKETAAQSRVALDRFAQEIKTEREGLWKTYPVLEQEPDLWRAITDHALLEAKRQRDATGRPSTYRLTDAVRDRWPLVLAFYRNRQSAPAAGGASAPVAMRSGGQEGASVATHAEPTRERQFQSADDAAAQWLIDHPNGFSG